MSLFHIFRMPAYDFSNWEALFFIIILIVLLYIFMSIVLAAIYNSYRDNLKVSNCNTLFKYMYVIVT